jgi:DNA adenine methylase
MSTIQQPIQQPLPISESVPARPFVKWAGGKAKLLPILLERVPTRFRRYYEPFVGGGALFFALRPGFAILNDSNAELMTCYAVVRDQPHALLEALSSFKINKTEFLAWRRENPADLDDVHRAARLIFLNKTCYNGLYRVNRTGQFNTPFGGYTHVRLAEPENILSASLLLQNVELRCGSFSAAVADAQAGDFVYLDPPYVPVGRYADFKRYTPEQFKGGDQVHVARVFRELHQKGCFVLLSNSKHPTVEESFAGFFQEKVHMPRYVNCRGTGRGEVEELLISNYERDRLLP